MIEDSDFYFSRTKIISEIYEEIENQVPHGINIDGNKIIISDLIDMLYNTEWFQEIIENRIYHRVHRFHEKLIGD